MKKLTKAMLSAATLCAFLGTMISPVRAADPASVTTYAPNAYDPGVNTGAPRQFHSGEINETFDSYSMGATNASPDTAIGNIPTGFFVAGDIVSGAKYPTHTGPVDSSIQDADDWDSDLPGAFGFWDFATSGSGHHALSILEQGSDSFQNGRIFLLFQNANDDSTPTTDIQGVHINYDVQQWVEGKRLNELRLRYATTVAGISGAPDLIVSQAAEDSGNNAGAVNGDLEQGNEDAIILFPSKLTAGSSAYFRWAFGTASTGNTSGHRDALGVTNVVIDPIPAGNDLTATNAATTWENTLPFTASATWSNGTTKAVDGAIFGSGFTASSITMSNTLMAGAGIHATDIVFNKAFTVNANGLPLVVDGPITVASGDTATINNAQSLNGAFGLIKSGAGTLAVTNSTFALTTGVSVSSGTLTLTGNTHAGNIGVVAVNSDNSSGTPVGATLNLTDSSAYTLAGLVGSKESTTGFGSVTNTVTLNVPAGATLSQRGAVTGSGLIHMVKDGDGTERFRTNPKAFNNDLVVKRGTFELTESTVASSVTLAGNKGVTVSGVTVTIPPVAPSTTPTIEDVQGTLLFSSSKQTTPTFRVGTAAQAVVIDMVDGILEGTNSPDSGEIVPNAISFAYGVDVIGNTVNSNTGDNVLTLTGPLSGIGFTKKGAGTLVLNAASNDSWSVDSTTGRLAVTDVNNGTLEINGTHFAGAGVTLTHQENASRLLTMDTDLSVDQLATDVDVLDANGNPFTSPVTDTHSLLLGNGEVDTNGHNLTLNMPASLDPASMTGAEYEASIQGLLVGAGTLTKTGTGYAHLSRYDKPGFTGSIVVSEGVLDISAWNSNSDEPTYLGTVTSGVGGIRLRGMTGTTLPVHDGGQLRLGSGSFDAMGNPVGGMTGGLQVWSLGPLTSGKPTMPIVLSSLRRTFDSIVMDNDNFDTGGALRYDPANSQSFTHSLGQLDNPILIEELDSPTGKAFTADIHVKGQSNTFLLNNTLSSAVLNSHTPTLSRDGGGILQIGVNSPGFSANTTLIDGVTQIVSGVTLGASSSPFTLTVGNGTSGDSAALEGGAGVTAGTVWANVVLGANGLLAGNQPLVSNGATPPVGVPSGLRNTVGNLGIQGSVTLVAGSTVVFDPTATPAINLNGTAANGHNLNLPATGTWVLDLHGKGVVNTTYNLFSNVSDAPQLDVADQTLSVSAGTLLNPPTGVTSVTVDYTVPVGSTGPVTITLNH